MNLDLSDEVIEFGHHAQRAFGSAGGDGLLQTAELHPERRAHGVEPVLAELGAWDLEPLARDDDLQAAAALCRSAGYWALPYPVAERLCRPRHLDSDGVVVVNEGQPAGTLAHLDGHWLAVTLSGQLSVATVLSAPAPPRATAFVTPLDLAPIGGDGAALVPPVLVLASWTLLGMLDRALELTRAYIVEREQFGQRLASFQGVQFQLTDAEVERIGVEALAKYALWSIPARPDDALADALALRLAAIDAAEAVFRVAHQLHGAIGFCDETTVSWLSRYSQPLRRLPLGASATRDELTRRLGRRGLTGLFSPGAEAQS